MQDFINQAVALYNALRPVDQPPVTPIGLIELRAAMGDDLETLKYIVGCTHDGLCYGNWLQNRRVVHIEDRNEPIIRD